MTEVSESGNEIVIDCNESLDISVVTDFKAMLQQVLVSSTSVVLDASHLTRIDTAALQLLSSLFRDAEPQGLSVTWKDPSEPLLSAADTIGLRQILKL